MVKYQQHVGMDQPGGYDDYQQIDRRVIKDITLKRPIVIGSIAQRLTKPRKQRTHSWRIYVRGLKNEDLGYFIKSVIFRIHEDFSNPRREILEAPFEVCETGW